MGLFRSYRREDSQPDPAPEAKPDKAGTGKKGPTPSRKEAEAARMERLHPTLSKKQVRAKERQAARRSRENAYAATERQPERVLLRDYIDARWSVTEFLLPVMFVMIALSFTFSRSLEVMQWITVLIWGVFAIAVLNALITWRGFKQELRKRMPHASAKGLGMYAFSRMTQIRRFRQPVPRIKRGDPY